MSGFFTAGRVYRRGRWTFQCLAVETAPWDEQRRAVGFLTRSDGTGIVHGMTDADWESWKDTDQPPTES